MINRQAYLGALFCALLYVGCTPRGGNVTATPEHLAEVDAWHAKRVQYLMAPEGWLALVGLHWLKDGAWNVGSNSGADLPLPSGHAAGMVGTLDVRGDAVTFSPAPDADVRAAGRRLTDAIPLQSDAAGGTPTLLTTGTVSFHLIKRGLKLALRVRDSESAARRDFHGIERFPVNDAWRFPGKFVPYNPAKKTAVSTVVGVTEEQVVPGAVQFTVEGKPYQLDAVQEAGEKDLFIVFADATAGKSTYGAGRFLYVSPPAPGSDATVIDFNKAYNPPCAFTPYSTCPLPAPQNRLPFPVEAGEKAVSH